MRLKKYLQFIKESVETTSLYWIDEEDIKNIFQYIIDEQYPLSISKIFFGYYGYSSGKFYNPNDNLDELVMFDIDQDDVILHGQEYYPAWRISVVKSQYSGDDVTDELQSAISQLKGEGYIVDTVEDEDGKTNLENIHLLKGSIITWIPEKPGKPFTSNQEEMSDGDVYISSSELVILIRQSEEVEMTEKMLAEIYEWKCDRIEGDSIYCHVEIDDMLRAILSVNDYKRWGKVLEEGELDIGDYYGDGYYPEIDSMFQYTLDKDNRVLVVKAMIQELGGLESTLKELEDSDIYKELVDKSEDEVIQILLEERFLRAITQLSRDSEIMGSIRETISDWEREAHCQQNWEDLINEFDECVSEVTEYTKFEKEIDKYYIKKDTYERVYYKSMVTHYEIPFEDKWIIDYGKSLKGYSLYSLFIEWCSDDYISYELNPRFKDWGDVDSKDLNKEIASILKYNLK
jgi:hypothetical protein